MDLIHFQEIKIMIKNWNVIMADPKDLVEVEESILGEEEMEMPPLPQEIVPAMVTDMPKEAEVGGRRNVMIEEREETIGMIGMIVAIEEIEGIEGIEGIDVGVESGKRLNLSG